jgi:hypothetical protein
VVTWVIEGVKVGVEKMEMERNVELERKRGRIHHR